MLADTTGTGIGLERITMSGPTTPLRLALIGAGRVGTAVTELLRRRGHVVAGVASRSADSARRAADFLDAEVFDHHATLPEADIVVLGVPDGEIEDVAGRLAKHVRGVGGPQDIEPCAVVHFAGASGIEPLTAVLDAGAGAAALHPVQACPDVSSAIERIPGSAWGVTTSNGLEAWVTGFVAQELSGDPVMVAEEDRPLWHAAATITSNGIAALLAIGEGLLSSIQVEAPEGVLGPLAAGTVTNAATRGGGAATLTGPVVRGEADTIAAHLERIAGVAPQLVEDYARVVRVIVAAALTARRIDEHTAGRVIRQLEDHGSHQE